MHWGVVRSETVLVVAVVDGDLLTLASIRPMTVVGIRMKLVFLR